MKPKLFLVIPVIASVAAVTWWSRQHVAPSQTELLLHGNVDIRQVELAFNGNGRIDQMLVREGDRVKKGQLLATLDTERLHLSEVQARAQTAAQQQVVARFQAGSRPEEIAQARAQRDVARVAVAETHAFYLRQLDLVGQHFVSQQQADSARYAMDRAQAQLKATEESLRLVELGPRQEDVAAARATLAANQAAVTVIQRDIQEGQLHAPTDGIVENRILEPGDMASPSKPTFTLALTDPIWVRAWLPETALGRVPVGARATVSSDSHPDRHFRAWVGYVSPSAEFTPKAVETTEVRASLVYQARIFVCEGQEQLRLGMPANVAIRLDQKLPATGLEPCKDAK